MRTRRSVVLDTNLLLLLLSVRTDITLLKTFKRVSMFTYLDFQRLAGVLQLFRSILTTPHILSETSNFIDQAPYWTRDALLLEFRSFVRGQVEVYHPAAALVARGEFDALGLTDTGILQLSMEAVIVTIDHRLAGKIEAIGGNALNFNHFQI